ncbi:Hsp70 family protein [Stappia sp. GBMRC 2046]|uniref:Hsp70 family protein n=1 Tax=Stappia sediminis TaxID=2692190 RepID=A0A7X3LRH5_9HYPH|nr:Hsp70 family protein [Stappia sediminis]MXN63754.1 Hsp70 family protein [Stappia sediminis]
MTANIPCGMDFGTSNSTVALAHSGATNLLPLEGERSVIPSTIFFSFEEDEVRFGRDAVLQYVGGVEGRLMRSLKSVLGSATMAEKTAIKTRRWGYGEIIGLFIREVRRRAENAAGRALDEVVLGRPVFFVDDDAAADRRAQDELEAIARDAGFTSVEFQFEPIAAALDHERTVQGEELAVIIDLGGGTSDFSVVRVSPEGRAQTDRRDDILASSGVHVGGTDFDQLLSLKRVMPEFGLGTLARDGKRDLPKWAFYELATWHRINFLYTSKAVQQLKELRYDAREPERIARLIELVERRFGHALAGTVEEAKIALSEADFHSLHIPMHDGDLAVDITVTDLVEAIQTSVGRVERALDECLMLAEVPATAVSTVFLTGGSASIPFVRDRLTRKFSDARIVQGNVFGSVGSGLALDAARKFGSRSEELAQTG